MLGTPPELGIPPAKMQQFLHECGLAHAAERAEFEQLGGGVSSAIFKVRLASGDYCIKKPLERLKVEKQWLVPVDRIYAEIDWLRLAHRCVPGRVPEVLGVNQEFGLYVMEYLDSEKFANWKARLFEEVVDPGVCSQVALLLATLHARTANDAQVARQFANHENFYLLRLEPYLVESARVNPAVAAELIELVHRQQSLQIALLHGDVSPKNVLLGPDGAVLVDAECACFGDPGFDIAFLMNHLLLKSVAIETMATDMIKLFSETGRTYFSRVSWEDAAALEERVVRLLPGLLLARVDGRSPVEYLSEPARHLVRDKAIRLLKDPRASIPGFLDVWLAGNSGSDF